MDILRWLLVGALAIAAVFAPFAIVVALGFIYRQVILPVYYFARYADELETRVRELEYDQRVLKYPGSLDHMNDMGDERGGMVSPRLREYGRRYEELQRERALEEKAREIRKLKHSK